MSSKRIIALLTDFGLQDAYVGVMKGAISCVNPDLQTIDITHQIPRQNISAARFALMNAVGYFPDETVYLSVVDPGVGSMRRGVAIQIAEGFLVGPDNGLFSGVLSQSEGLMAVELTNSKFWLTLNPSNTFHGRDIFAPVAAYLASGIPIEELGVKIELDTLSNLPIREYQVTETEIIGFIQYMDGFGNVITNIPATALDNHKSWWASVGNLAIPSGLTYNSVSVGEMVALIGSHGWVEVAVNHGNAREKLNLYTGDLVTIRF